MVIPKGTFHEILVTPSSSIYLYSKSNSSQNPTSLYFLLIMIPSQVPASSASSSSSKATPKRYYDVYLSFTSESTFISTLLNSLLKRGINRIFVDPTKLMSEMQQVLSSPEDDPLSAIEKSKILILVFSEDYASSADCLDELVKIMECRRNKKQVVFPIFYEIDPSVVRYQKNKYGEAINAHEERLGDERVQKWKWALKEAAGLSGWHFIPQENEKKQMVVRHQKDECKEAMNSHKQSLEGERDQKWISALKNAADLSGWQFDQGSDNETVENIAETAYSNLSPKGLHIGEYIVGLDTHIKRVTSLLDSGSILVIHGTEGVGKTTLAKAAYNSFVHQFEEACFLSDIREASKESEGMVGLQRKLLSEIHYEKEKSKLISVDEGISKIKQRLTEKRVLLVLDDVDEKEQLEQLVGDFDWCVVSGSKVIVTTRRMQLVIDGNINNEYEMKELNEDDSLELFSRYAFHLEKPTLEYEEISKSVVSYARGLPSALKAMGSELNHKSMTAWKCVLDQLERLPEAERLKMFSK